LLLLLLQSDVGGCKLDPGRLDDLDSNVSYDKSPRHRVGPVSELFLGYTTERRWEKAISAEIVNR
jgi:hypothetical protein